MKMKHISLENGVCPSITKTPSPPPTPEDRFFSNPALTADICNSYSIKEFLRLQRRKLTLTSAHPWLCYATSSLLVSAILRCFNCL